MTKVFNNANRDEALDGMEPRTKRPITVLAKQMDDAFTVVTKEGVMQGKAGDYLICGIEGELYPCDKKIFENSYD